VGWAQRLRKQTLARYKPIAARECADLAHKARALLDQLGLTLDARSDLEEMISDVEFLGRFSGDPLSAEGAWATDKQRTVRAFLRVEQTRRLVGTLAQVPLIKNAESHLKWFRKRLDRLRRKTPDELREPEAEDFLFELEIAGRFAGWERHEVALEEPDIVLKAGDTRLPLACKRPRSVKGLKRAIVNAARQLPHQSSGFVIIGSEYLLHAQDELGRPASIVAALSEAHAVEEGGRLLQAAEESACPEIAKAFEVGLGGILFVGVLIYLTRDPMVFGYHWLTRTVVNRTIPFAPELLTMLEEVLVQKYPTQERLEQLFAAADQEILAGWKGGHHDA